MRERPEDEIFERLDALRRGNQIKTLLSKKYDHIDSAPEEKYRSFNMTGAQQEPNLGHYLVQDSSPAITTTYSLTDANDLVK